MTVRIYGADVETKEITEQKMSAEELTQWQLDLAAMSQTIADVEATRLAAEEQARLDAEAKAVAKATILAKLGLNEEEISVLLNNF